MKTRAELIAEVLRYWPMIDPDATFEEKAKAAKGGKFTSSDLYDLIRDQQKQIEMLVEALEGLYRQGLSLKVQSGNERFVVELMEAKSTLARIASGDWME